MAEETFLTAYFEKEGEKGQKFSIKPLQIKDLPEDEVLVKVDYSTMNYKDALAITGKSPIVRVFPLVGGIDYAGTVVESKNPSVKPGDVIVANGAGAGETCWGGYGRYVKTKAAHLVSLPPSISTKEAMAIGTGGYTAMLCVLSLVDHNITPKNGPIIVTGAVVGVGSFAVALLSSMGYDVIACTGRVEEHGEYLKQLGAKEVVARNTLGGKPKPLGKTIYAGCVDSVAGDILANIISCTKPGGVVAACGLAASTNLNTSIMPFILRGVILAGIDSVNVSLAVRQRAWKELDKNLDRKKLALICSDSATIGLNDLESHAKLVMDGKHKGRVVVDVNK